MLPFNPLGGNVTTSYRRARAQDIVEGDNRPSLKLAELPALREIYRVNATLADEELGITTRRYEQTIAATSYGNGRDLGCWPSMPLQWLRC